MALLRARVEQPLTGQRCDIKNIVIFLDGTGNQVGAKLPTNVVNLYELLDLSDPTRQIAFYDPGVGTMSSAQARGRVGRWLSRLSGLAFGTGLKTNLAEAYLYLSQHWQPGDAVYIFGFSRGAYTARALAGMLTKPGLMRPGSDNLMPYAVAKYATNGSVDWTGLAHFSHAFCWRTENEPLFENVKVNDPTAISHHAIPITYLGVWDTVKAAGFLRFGNLLWPYTRQLPNAARIRHAVSIDEHRRPYREYLVEPKATRTEGLEEVWFAGVHSDIGGTFEKPDHDLATITLKWIVEGASGGLIFRPGAVADACAVSAEFAVGTIHKMGWIWVLTGTRHRPLPAGAVLHASVKARRAANPKYLPTLPEDQIWADADWLTPSG